ncbi:MAG: class I SAM-dependent methyltransferase [Elstera sp.]
MADALTFIRAQTALKPPSAVPELLLHLADEALPLWQATEAELQQSNLPPPYWAFAWPGGQALARYLLDHPELVAGKRVLDLGAGCGITSLAAAKAGAISVLAADIDVYACTAITLNAEANGLPQVRALSTDLLANPPPESIDLLLVGDMCYEKPLAEKAIAWATIAAARGVPVLLADPGRAYVPTSGLIERARYTIPTSLDLEDRETRETIIYALTA